ncbi:hypothetical protein IIV31_154L [Armadillidium vulgare iridescent virus]|uniref:C2H2-type domain-containing protein n=1 Tax=Armadillidium vulgare iridescent virus TaxID=72201 RepID=A0A068QKM5_9VIRU|nr:hypothetical protein IIV31_154L [Armadillidium vulgare iridescent virus]CCV02526.1 hypothetical protein IIV31_154L [Armadillidium vulgare iridescent virus]
MNLECEYCNKMFETKTKMSAHQKTKKCQLFRAISFVCRNCSNVILGYDNVIEHLEICKADKPIHHSTIEKLISNPPSSKNKKIGKGLNGSPVYIFRYEQIILSSGTPPLLSENISKAINLMVEKATVKTVEEFLQSFSKEALENEVTFVYPEPYTISDIYRFFEDESKTILAFLLAKSLHDLLDIIFGWNKVNENGRSKTFKPFFKEGEKYYVITEVKKIKTSCTEWELIWNEDPNIQEGAFSFKGLVLPALKFAFKLHQNNGENPFTSHICELISEVSNVHEILKKYSSGIPSFDDVRHTISDKRFVFKSDIKHTPFNSIIKGWSDEKADIDNFLKLIVE